ncbi:6606_t:CDS:2 [Entrophospora sp. SA101]|nr:8081_t:CDS:2 [Entrophospora sp. SA101]CAJ0856833.1 6606_t:CDS:2 [Entrophospora sp. SA101]
MFSTKRSVATQTTPVHIVERSLTVCLNNSKSFSKATENPSFTMLKVTCVQHISYNNVRLNHNVEHLCDEEMKKLDQIKQLTQNNKKKHFVNRIDGKLYSLNTKKENIILKQLCRSEIWNQFGFSHIEAEPAIKQRKYNKALLRKKLLSKKLDSILVEIQAIDTAFKTLMKKSLITRYPLIFSPGYIEKLENLNRFIPSISKSLTRIIKNSANEDFCTKAMDLVQYYRDDGDDDTFVVKAIIDLTFDQVRSDISDGLCSISRDIKVPAPFLDIKIANNEKKIQNELKKDFPVEDHEIRPDEFLSNSEQFDLIFDNNDNEIQDLDEKEFEQLSSSDDDDDDDNSDFWDDDNVVGIENKEIIMVEEKFYETHIVSNKDGSTQLFSLDESDIVDPLELNSTRRKVITNNLKMFQSDYLVDHENYPNREQGFCLKDNCSNDEILDLFLDENF